MHITQNILEYLEPGPANIQFANSKQLLIYKKLKFIFQWDRAQAFGNFD